MVKLPIQIWITPPDGGGEVLVFGKSPEQVRSDHKAGIARLGGPWRYPSYLHAYRRAAEVLVRYADAAGELDQMGLPIFYLQRHTAELFLKRLIGYLHEISRYRLQLQVSQSRWEPSNNSKERLTKSHDLQRLWADLCEASIALDHGEPPSAVGDLIDRLVRVETHPTWARYEASGPDGANKHVEKEVLVPVVDNQATLTSVMASTLYAAGSDDYNAYEFELYAELEGLWQRAEAGLNE